MKVKMKMVNGVNLVVVSSKVFKGETPRAEFTIQKDGGASFIVNIVEKNDGSRKVKNFLSYSLEGAVDMAKAY